MKHSRAVLLAVVISVFIFAMPVGSWAGEAVSLENYILGYTYASRKEMKATSGQLLDWIEDGKAVLVDIRFAEEQQAWGAGFGLRIPLSELPRRLAELPKDKIIVTACPHKDRATIAMVFLRTRGFDARYLTDGLIGLAENLRGDDALYFMKVVNENGTSK